MLRILILIFLSSFSITSYGYLPAFSNEDMQYAKNLQERVQKITQAGIEAKYQEYAELSKDSKSDLSANSANITDQSLLSEDGTKLRILVSSSMSMNLLQSYYKEAQKYGGHLVFNGLPGGSFKELLQLAQKIVGSSDIGAIEIDDEAFREFKAYAVPTIILSKEKDNLFSADEFSLKYDSIQGAVSTKYALEEFASKGDLKESAKRRLAGLAR